jgi:autophagy-related protein 16
MRQQVLQLLQERNRKEKGFTELFKHHERLFENWAAVRLENIRLMQNQGGYGSGRDDGGSEEKDKKILRLQEELTELHRNRGENASQVLSLSAKLTQKEAELSALQSQNAELVARIADLEEKEAQLNNNLHEHEATIALLHDEHSVLQLDFTSLEEKFRKVQMEYSELLQRYMLVKNQHAEVMNKENELFMEKKRAAVQKELEDAASEKVVTPVEGAPILGVEIPQIPTICIVPKNAAHKFEAHENEVNSIRWSPNAKHFATGNE